MNRTAIVIGGPKHGKLVPMAGIYAVFPFVDDHGYFNVTVPWTILGQDRYAVYWEDGQVSPTCRCGGCMSSWTERELPQ